MEKQIAAKLYINRNSSEDLNLRLLRLLNDLEGANIEEVIKSYELITSGKIKVAHTLSSVDLESEQRSKIESKINSMFKDEELVFVFEVDEAVEFGIQIKVGDDEISFSTNSKLNDVLAENGN
ncbi:F0F1 ATP synthase subunit delta [Candidatus Dojkabacteria bacterium]|uniref:F0F1 ATP synthase subunit delta n=1 Tax=Candidatus Dojkabacteria bacterium TaxID=2099670 RepID=A0A955RJB7_9BACT|nr:F0F1 ATP synthase subunit delta [Candidatus Dojkabacteria bacterium]